MRNVWKIASWEIMRNLTNKQFIFGLLLTPIIMVLFGGAPALLERWNQPASVTYYVVDEVGAAEGLQKLLPENIVLERYGDTASIGTAVKDNKASGYFHLTNEFFTTGRLDLMLANRNAESVGPITAGLTAILQQHRLARAEISPEQLIFVTAPAEVNRVSMDEESGPQEMHMIASGVFTFLVFFLIVTSGGMLMQSALQEKRDRMAEIVLSSIKPSALMSGKILGHFALGCIQLGFWLALGLPFAIYFLEFPVVEALKAVNLPVILFFGLGGFLMYSSLFVGMGATMEDLQSASNSQGMVVMLPMMSMLFLAPVITNPDGTIAVFASLLPFTSPAIMMLRIGLTSVPLWQILTSGAILLVTARLSILMAAKIFRVGMLMYGKTATPKEIIKWLRYKEN